MKAFRYLISKSHKVIALVQSWRKRLSLLVLMGIIAIACSRINPEQIQPLASEPKTALCKTIQYALKETCIPLNSNKIVVLDHHQLLPTLIALGIRPIGAMTLLNKQEALFLEGMTSGIKDVGYFSTPPILERLVMLHPDLILGWDFFSSTNELMSQIAPTVLFSFTEAAHNWQQLLKIVATEFGKAERADELLNKYRLRVQEMHRVLGSQPQKLSASCISIYSGAMYLVAGKTPVDFVFTDIGLERSSLENAAKDSYFAISEEKLAELDTDIIFIAASGEKDKNFAKKLQEKPLWKKLKAVQRHQVYQVDADTWTSFNVLAINAMLDDLHRYLITSTRAEVKL